MTEDDALALLEAFAFNVITDPACRCASYTMTPLMSGTVVHYLKSTAAVIKVIFGVSVSVLADGMTHLLPVFHDLISHVRKWQCPKKRREPYTTAMFDAVDSHVQSQCQRNPKWFLSWVAAVNDWVHLGFFTGSRGNEYCQTLTGRHDVSRVPDTAAAGEFAGQPLAFMECDFTFYNGMNSCMTRLELICESSRAVDLHVRFRYDKSPINFSIRKFQRTGHSYLCPVTAAIRIILRASLLHVRAIDPLACYHDVDDKKSKLPEWGYFYLRSSDIICVMRTAVDWAYPDPQNYMRLHREQVDCHSNRVTAAVALQLGGLCDEEIAFCLRWSVASVKHYLRDCNKAIGPLTQRVIAGSYLL